MKDSNELRESLSFQERTVAVEQDDLRNFDMNEWGKISVDNHHDNAKYGDAGMLDGAHPIALETTDPLLHLRMLPVTIQSALDAHARHTE